MIIFANICSLFIIGSLSGWVIELFFRRFVSQHKWMNPGFLSGPYLPIYGFGVLFLYMISYLFSLIPQGGVPQWLLITIEVIAIGIIITILEFIAGLIFIKGLNMKLWDYSDRKGNIMGIVCPIFAIAWTAVGAIYFFFIHENLVDALEWLATNTIYYMFIGIVLGMMIADFAYSISLAHKVKELIQNTQIEERYEQVKQTVRKRRVETVEELENIISKEQQELKEKLAKQKEKRMQRKQSKKERN